MKALQRALSDTLGQAGRFGGIAMTFGGAIFGYISQRLLAGQPLLNADVSAVQSAVLGSASVLFLLFCYNLLAAPYRLMRDRAVRAELSEKDLQCKLREVEHGLPRLVLLHRATMWGGDIVGDPNNTPIVEIMHVVNAGTMPTVLLDWRVVYEEGGISEEGRLFIHDELVASAEIGDHRLTRADNLFIKLATPLASGALAGGYVSALFTKAKFPWKDGRVSVFAKDVTGREYSMHKDLVAEGTKEMLGEFPDISIQRYRRKRAPSVDGAME